MKIKTLTQIIMTLEMTTLYSRSLHLQNRLNKHLTKLTGVEDDYYTKLSQANLIELKSVLSDIHNVLTLKLTLTAATWLASFFKLKKAEKEKLLLHVDSTSPNSKGFDIQFEGSVNFLAEVKCIDPVKRGKKFGAAQRNAILSDFNKLKDGKYPVHDTSTYYKFLFLLNLGDRSTEALNALLKQTKIRVETPVRLQRNEIKNAVMVLDAKHKAAHLNLSSVYVKIIDLD
jgi:hypothetical protein